MNKKSLMNSKRNNIRTQHEIILGLNTKPPLSLHKKVKRMEILMSVPVPFFRSRGTSFSTYNRCKVLSELGHRIDLLTYPIGENVEIKNLKIYRAIKVPFIKDIGLGPSLKMFILDFLLSLKMLFMCLNHRYDCIHAHEETIFMGVILKKLCGLPLVYDMHSSIPQLLTNFGYTKNRLFINIMKLFESLAIKNSDIIIVICPHLKETVCSVAPDKKVIVIENRPINESDIAEIPNTKIDDFRKELELSNEKIILYTGTFGYNQGLELLLKTTPLVIENEKNIKYVLVGGEPKRIKKLQNFDHDLGIEKYIIFAGPRPAEEMPIFMAIADILISPRITGTNTPLKIYSYLKSGKPIVATNLLTHTQVLNDDVSILVEPEPRAFADGIIRLLKDSEMGEEIGGKGKRMVETKYRYENFVQKTKDVYKFIERRRIP